MTTAIPFKEMCGRQRNGKKIEQTDMIGEQKCCVRRIAN